MGLDTKTYWLTDRQSQCDFDFDFDRKGSAEKIAGREFQAAWRQDELIGGKPPVVK
jgi:hypothetical protein